MEFTHESVDIYIGRDGHSIKKVIAGDTLAEAVSTVRFDAVQLHDQFRRTVMKKIKDGSLSSSEGNDLIEFYEKQADGYTYLSPNNGQ